MGQIGRRRVGLALLAPVALALLVAGCSREAADWKQATLANTPEAYQLFLQQHPRGAEAVQARSRLQQLSAQRDWQIASSADTRSSYQQFLDQHPDSPWAQEARIRIENFARTAAARAPGPAAGGNATLDSANPPVVHTPTVSSPTTPAPTTQASVAPAPGVQAPVASGPAAGSSAAAPSAASASAAHHAGRHAGSAAAHEHLAGAARSGTSRTVQLGAFSSRARAEHQWRLLSARYASLRSLHPRYVRVSGRSGTLYRLQVRLASPAAAQGLCATLHRHAQACVRVNA